MSKYDVTLVITTYNEEKYLPIPKNISWIKYALFGWAIKLYQQRKKIDKNNYNESIR